MHSSRWLPRLVALGALWLGLNGSLNAADSAASPYEARLAAARALEKENSHHLASVAFAEAMALAPDEDAKRWCELWMLEAAWHEGSSGTRTRLRQSLSLLLAPYGKGPRPRDAFWAEAARFSAGRLDAPALATSLEVARYWAELPPTAENAERLAAAADTLASDLPRYYSSSVSHELASASLAFLRQAATAAPEGEGRARLALLYAEGASELPGPTALSHTEIESAFAAAVTAARGTPAEAEARLEEAGWLGRFAPADFAPLLAKIDAALAAAGQLTTDSLKRQIEDLREFRTALLKPSLSLDLADAFQPESRLVFDLQVQNISSVDLALFPLAPEEFARLSRIRNRDPFDRVDKPDPAAASLPPAAPLHTWQVATGVPADGHGRRQLERGWDGGLPPGRYLLTARDPAHPEAAPLIRCFLVTAAQAIAHVSDAGMLELHAFALATGQPLRKLTGTIIWSGAQSQPFATDADGRTRFQLKPPPKDFSDHPIVIGDADGQPFSLQLSSDFDPESSAPSSTWLFHLLTDRPLYQPGETARWKVTVRDRTTAELRTPAGTRLKVSAFALSRNGRPGDTLGTWEVLLGRFGTASGELALPATMATAQVGFRFQAIDDAKPEVDGSVEAFWVDRFRAPEAKLTIKPAPGRLDSARPGGDLELVVNASYFTGEPIAAGGVELRASFSPAWHEPDSVPYRDRHDSPPPVNLAVSTDLQGQAHVHVPIPADLPESTSISVSGSLHADGVAAKADLDFDLLRSGYTVSLRPATNQGPNAESNRDGWRERDQEDIYYAPPAQPFALALITRDGWNSPVAATGEIAVRRMLWDEIWRSPAGELVTGAALRLRQSSSSVWPPRDATGAGWEKIRATWRTESLVAQTVSTDAQGRATFTTPALTPGRYEVVYQPAKAAPDAVPLARLELFVADASTTELPNDPSSHLRIVPVKTQLDPGQPLRALVVLPVGGRPVWLNLITSAGGDSRVELFPGNARLVEFPWRAGAWAGARMEADLLVGHDYYDRYLSDISFEPAPEPHRLNIALAAEGNTPRPGDKARLTIRTTDAGGRPLVGEVAVVAADAAIASLTDGRQDDITAAMLEGPRLGLTYRQTSDDPKLFPRANPGGAPAKPDEDLVKLEVLNPESGQDPFGGQTVMGMAPAAASAMVDPFAAPGGSLNQATTSVRVRTAFSYTAAWLPDVQTDAKGEASVEFTYPDNLTAWQVSATGIAEGNRFGSTSIETRTTLPFQARLRMPRALVAGDTAELTGVMVNTTNQAGEARAELTVTGSPAVVLPGPIGQTLTMPATSEIPVFWDVHAFTPGESTVRLTARSGTESDAMELKLPVTEDGFIQHTGTAGRNTDQPLALSFALPTPLDPKRTAVNIEVSPGVVPSLVEALPYLVDYPYGCVEQTMSRFLPAVAVSGLLRDLGVDKSQVEQVLLARRSAGTEKDPAQLEKLDDVIAQSFSRLTDAQDWAGRFGWWPEGPRDAYMTGYVLRGLNAAVQAGAVVPEDLHQKTYEGALDFLKDEKPSIPELERAWLLAAAATFPKPTPGNQPAPAPDPIDPFAEPHVRKTPNLVADLSKTFTELYASRDKLPPSGIALLLQAAQALNRKDEIPVLVRNLENGVVRAHTADLGDTAQWGQTTGYYDGMEGAIETTALCLQSLLAVDPHHPLIEPAVQWLLINRQSSHWTNTRDTALAVLALHAYAKSRHDLSAAAACTLTLNGHALGTREFTKESLLSPAVITVDAAQLVPGENRLVVTRTRGSTACYVTVVAHSWARGDSVVAGGDFLKTSRSLARLVEQPTLLGTVRLVPQVLPEKAGSLMRGERLEYRVQISTAHDLDYVMVVAPKPAGCEPLNPLSGWDAELKPLATADGPATGDADDDNEGRQVYREEHDDRSVFFLPHLAAGRWEIRYTMRAAFAGDYRVLPVTMEAMYVPLLAAHSDSRRLQIESKAK